jgi:hypothetical protein
MSKGSKSRVNDHGAFRANYERIFGKKSETKVAPQVETSKTMPDDSAISSTASRTRQA